MAVDRLMKWASYSCCIFLLHCVCYYLLAIEVSPVSLVMPAIPISSGTFFLCATHTHCACHSFGTSCHCDTHTHTHTHHTHTHTHTHWHTRARMHVRTHTYEPLNLLPIHVRVDFCRVFWLIFRYYSKITKLPVKLYGIFISFQKSSTCCVGTKSCLFSAKVCKRPFWG